MKTEIHVNQLKNLIVEGEEERVVLPFIGLCISDDLPDVPVEASEWKELQFKISCCKTQNSVVYLMRVSPHSQMNVP